MREARQKNAIFGIFWTNFPKIKKRYKKLQNSNLSWKKLKWSRKKLKLFGFKTQRTGSGSLHPTTIKVVKKAWPITYYYLHPGLQTLPVIGKLRFWNCQLSAFSLFFLSNFLVLKNLLRFLAKSWVLEKNVSLFSAAVQRHAHRIINFSGEKMYILAEGSHFFLALAN